MFDDVYLLDESELCFLMKLQDSDVCSYFTVMSSMVIRRRDHLIQEMNLIYWLKILFFQEEVSSFNSDAWSREHQGSSGERERGFVFCETLLLLLCLLLLCLLLFSLSWHQKAQGTADLHVLLEEVVRGKRTSVTYELFSEHD